jgi:hypothetical protein
MVQGVKTDMKSGFGVGLRVGRQREREEPHETRQHNSQDELSQDKMIISRDATCSIQ